ncbi:MAG: hypothetical protein EA350_14715 [Gemmatimonadales bacterium]|nr:MAG: hypothetical protein EA350_14715 [Gemmatimonadales bacterium]
MAVAALLIATTACDDAGRGPTAPLSPGEALMSTAGSTVLKLDPASTVDTDIYGPGVTPFEAPCPAGYVATGMAGTTARWFGLAIIAEARLHCRQLLGDGSLGTSAVTTAHPGGTTSELSVLQPFNASCSVSSALVAVGGQVSTQVGEIGGTCDKVSGIVEGTPSLETLGPWRDAGGSLGTSPVAFIAACAPGSVVTGLIGRSGSVLDAVGARCTAIIEVCAAGSFWNGDGCELAAPGTYVPGHGMTFAFPCALGRYQPAAGQTSCLDAPIGTYVDVLGAVAPTPCPTGTTTLAAASSSAADCVVVGDPPGYTPEGKDVRVAPKDATTGEPKEDVKLTFDSVEKSGETTIETKAFYKEDGTPEEDVPPEPEGYKLPEGKTFLDIKTDAEFTGEVTVCAEFDGSAFPKKESTKLLHYKDGGWEDITTSVDEDADTVCGKTSSFSPFVVAQELYAFSGFLRPVENLPTLNRVQAGRAIPVKFSLGGEQGLGILATGYPISVQTACESSSAINGVEETVTAGSSSLSYDAEADQYTYVWRTDRGWASTCRQLVVRLDDGSEYRANFHFVR